MVRSEGPDGRLREYRYHRRSRLRIHAEPGTPEFAEEYRLAADGHKTLKGRQLIASRREKPPVPTNVYFIRAETSGLIKVGRAQDVARRLTVLQIGSSEQLTLLGVIRDSSGGLLERAIHREFSAAWVRGEWFKPDPALLAHVNSALT